VRMKRLFLPDVDKKSKAQRMLEKKAATRIAPVKKVEAVINQAAAERFAKTKKNKAILKDDRFTDMFNKPDFAIEEDSNVYLRTHRGILLNQRRMEQKQKEAEKSDEEEEEEEEDDDDLGGRADMFDAIIEDKEEEGEEDEEGEEEQKKKAIEKLAQQKGPRRKMMFEAKAGRQVPLVGSIKDTRAATKQPFGQRVKNGKRRKWAYPTT